MNEAICRPLIEVLAEIPDFRKSRGKRHSLAAILVLACAAMLCGYKSYGAIAEWGRLYGAELARKLGFKEGKTPSVGTLHTVFRYLDKKAFEACLGKWAECSLQHTSAKTPLQGIAIDGKTLRGIRTRATGYATSFSMRITPRVRCGNIPQVMAALRNTVIGPLRLHGKKQITATLRRHAARPEEVLEFLGIPKTE